MLAWVEAVPSILVSLAVLFVPGLLVAIMIGLRGLWAASLSPLISISVWVIVATVLPLVGLSWTPAVALPAALITVLIIAVLFRWVVRGEFSLGEAARPSSTRWAGPAAWGIGAVILSSLFMVGVGHPAAISQTYDNIFHLNLLAYMRDSLGASSLTAGLLVSPDASTAFYPNGWHVVVNLVQTLSGTDIPTAVNATNFALLIGVFPAGVLVLVRQFVESSTLGTLVTGIVLAAFPALPLNLLTYGVLYPFFLGLVLAPAMLAVVCQVLGLTKDRRLGNRSGLVLLLVGLVPGITIAHPGAAMGVLALSVPMVVVATFRDWGSVSVNKRVARLITLVAFGGIGLAMLVRLRPSVESTWAPPMSLPQASFQTLGLGLLGYGTPFVLAALVMIGLIAALRRKDATDIGIVFAWLVAALMFFVAAWAPYWKLRVFTVGVWYADTPRLAAIFVLALIPLAVMGTCHLFELVSARGARSRKITQWIGALVAVVVFASAGYVPFIKDMRQSYAMTEKAPLISDDEQRLLDRIPEIVPQEQVIVGNPWTGTALAYALSEREVMLPHVSASPDAQQQLILQSLRDATSMEGVCDAVRDERISYVLDFGTLEVHGASHRYPGIERLESSSAVQLVAQEGEAKLYRITACG